MLQFLMIVILAVYAVACSRIQTSAPQLRTPRPITRAPEAKPEIDKDAARKLSDSIVEDYLYDRRKPLKTRMESGLRDALTDEAYGKILDQMGDSYGKPLDAEYKMDESGWKTAPGYNKPVRKFWYATQTSKYPKGQVFILVEIVPDGDELAGSGLSLVTFPLGGIPDDLR